jgi:hypothetical protein
MAATFVSPALGADLAMLPLDGKPLRYLIGAGGDAEGHPDEITEVGYRAKRPPRHGIGIKYGNLFDEHNTGEYGPYLHSSDTAREYGEGQIDPNGPGWQRNIDGQLERAKRQGFGLIEWDNADAYPVVTVLGAVSRAADFGLQVVAKNPLLLEGGHRYVAHRNVVGIIVEHDKSSTPAALHALRVRARRPDLPVWFVAFGRGREWANAIAPAAQRYRMGVTYSTQGEYRNAVDVVRPG